jgi:hypothetical protein
LKTTYEKTLTTSNDFSVTIGVVCPTENLISMNNTTAFIVDTLQS